MSDFKPGDVYTDSYPRGGRRPRPREVWLAMDIGIDRDQEIVLINSFGVQQRPEWVESAYGPLTLVHREDAS